MKKQLQKGTTLVELLLYMGIFLLMLIVLMQIFSSILDVQLESQASSSVAQDGKYILQRMLYDIRSAQSISLPATPGNTGTTLQIVVAGVTYVYTANAGYLQLTKNNTTDNLNSVDTTISNLSFQRLGNATGKNTITISFTLTSNTSRFEGKEVQIFQETVGLP